MRRALVRAPSALVFGCGLLAAASLLMAAPPGEQVHPMVEEHGGFVPVPDSLERPKPYSKLVLDVTGAGAPGTTPPALESAARILNEYGHAGVADTLQLTIVLHGDATRLALEDAAYGRRLGGADENPSLQLLRALKCVQGVQVFVCGQALAERGWQADEVAEPVLVASSATVVLANRQMLGFAYLPFHPEVPAGQE